jgi:hypothetical protein
MAISVIRVGLLTRLVRQEPSAGACSTLPRRFYQASSIAGVSIAASSASVKDLHVEGAMEHGHEPAPVPGRLMPHRLTTGKVGI